MKVVLYMASTVNGYIAADDDSTPWSEAEWQGFQDFVDERSNLIVGRRTYEIMTEADEFSRLDSPHVVVLSKSISKSPLSNAVFVDTPQKALQTMKDHGVREAIVGGGSKTNAAFLRASLLDEIYLDLDPLIFGKGIKLFEETAPNHRLKLLAVKNLSKDTLRLHYKILK